MAFVYTAISKAFNEDMFGEVEGGGADLQAMMDWLSANNGGYSPSDRKAVRNSSPVTILQRFLAIRAVAAR